MSLTLGEKLEIHLRIMPNDPRLDGLTIVSEVTVPTEVNLDQFLTTLRISVNGNVIEIPFDKAREFILEESEVHVLTQLFMALPLLIRWVLEYGMSGLIAFVHESPPENVLPALESDWIRLELATLNGVLPA